MFRLILAAPFTLPCAALSQSAPSFECDQAGSEAEKLICTDPALAELDARVAERFEEALRVTQSLDTNAEEAEAELRGYQRGWISGRDECWKAEDLRQCIEDAYQNREGALVAQYMLEPPVKQVFWQCDGNPANELVTSFFDTAQPSLRIERGDRIMTGSLSPTGSGARYDAEFGAYLWIKGDEATYRSPDPEGIESHCVASK